MTHNMKLTNASTTLENAPEHMLALWERRIPSRQKPIILTAQRSITLKVLFKHVFLSKLTGWESFIDLIHHCNGYLSGKHSCLSDGEFFDWAITPNNCLDVMNGVYLEEKTKLIKAKNMITLPELSDKLSAAMAEEAGKLSASAPSKTTQNELQKALTTAKQWWERLFSNGVAQYVPEEHRPPLVELCNLLRLNFLAPSIQQAIIDGTQPATMTLELIQKRFPKSFDEQLVHFGFSQHLNH